MKKLLTSACLVLALTACGETALQKWAQSQKAFNGAVSSMSDFMEYCTPNERIPDGSLDHPQCHVSLDAAEVFNVVRVRAQKTLDKARDAAVAERENDASFYLKEASFLLDDMLLYTTRAEAGGTQ